MKDVGYSPEIDAEDYKAALRKFIKTLKFRFNNGLEIHKRLYYVEFEDLAVRAAKAVGCKIAGVDILEGPDGPKICDVNSQPGWKGLQMVTKVNIAERIVDFVLSEVKR
jgi:ribosomal protein S6--L-glutamate ligase